MLVGIEFAENTPQGISVALLRRIWNARLATGLPQGCRQWIWQSTYVYVKTHHAVICAESVSVGHPL